MKKIKLNVKTKSKTYPIIIGKNVIAQISSILKSKSFMPYHLHLDTLELREVNFLI